MSRELVRTDGHRERMEFISIFCWNNTGTIIVHSSIFSSLFRITLTFSHREPAPSVHSSQPGAPRGFYDYPSEIVAARHVVGSSAELDEIQSRFEGGAAR